MKMKFGANTLIWVLSFTEKDFPLLDKIAGMGFDAVEITPGAEFRKLDPGKLRKKLEADPSKPRHILTIRGAGYKFVPQP